MLSRSELQKPPTLTNHFLKIRNVLAGQVQGMTLDQTLVEQIMNILFCKLYDEQNCLPDDVVRFQVFDDETSEELSKRIQKLFTDVKSSQNFVDIFRDVDTIEIPPDLLTTVVETLQPFDLTHASRDIVGEAFEVFIGPSLRGNKGQFFTPRNVVQLACQIINPKNHELVLDPACGTGGFLTEILRLSAQTQQRTRILGIDKDSFLAKVAAVQVCFMDQDNTIENRIHCADSLRDYHEWPTALLHDLKPSSVDVIVTNPPFGSKISVNGSIVKNYQLGHMWKSNKAKNEWVQTDRAASSRPPQLLFIERCIQLLKPGGRMGIVLPDGVLGNISLGYVRSYIRHHTEIVGIVDLPLETFLPSTSTKTSLLFLRKKDGDIPQQSHVFMALAQKCGHDRRGNPITTSEGELEDDLPVIATKFRDWSAENAADF